LKKLLANINCTLGCCDSTFSFPRGRVLILTEVIIIGGDTSFVDDTGLFPLISRSVGRFIVGRRSCSPSWVSGGGGSSLLSRFS